MPRKMTWRVRVKRNVEDWVDVDAETGAQAETEAYNLPGITSVFAKSAIPGNAVTAQERPPGVLE